jgi:hypothetical protein
MSTHMKVPNEGQLAILQVLIDNKLTSLYARLFRSTKTPAAGDVLADYAAIECTFPGYAAIAQNSWATPTLVAGRAYSECPLRTFTRTSGGSGDTVYGFFLADAATGSSGKLYGAQLFDTTVDMTVNGNSFPLLNTYTDVTEY